MVDRYTKAVLTVIAVCLLWLVVRDVTLVKPAQAASPTEVVVTGWRAGTVIVEIDSISPLAGGVLPVRVVY